MQVVQVELQAPSGGIRVCLSVLWSTELLCADIDNRKLTHHLDLLGYRVDLVRKMTLIS